MLAGGQGQAPLSFLFKVLSVRTALSIQVHPNKEQAERLHKERPDVYKDDNHKPELAIALTPFLALCGFRPRDEIMTLLNALRPLTDLIGAERVAKLASDDAEAGLRICFARLMHTSDDDLRTTISHIRDLLPSLNNDLISSTFTKVCNEFPNDVGILAIFFMNIISLRPGEAIFLGANVPHAYLSGDCIECMACSDNVIRAGLTPKYKDVETLIEMLDYKMEPMTEKLFQGEESTDGVSKLFLPPVPDFAVKEIRIQTHQVHTYRLKNWRNGSILLVLKGAAELIIPERQPLQLKPGSIIFIPSSNAEFSALVMNLSGDEQFLAYQAFSNEMFHS